MSRAPAPSSVAAIASSIGVLAVAAVLTKSVGLGKELVVADAFGTAPTLETYLLALVVCNFLVGLVAHSLPTAFIPVLVRQKERGQLDDARRLVTATSWVAIAVGVAAAVVVTIVAGALVGPEHREATAAVAILAPVVPLAGVASVWGAVLHAERRFWAVSLAPVATPVAIVTMLLVTEAPHASDLAGATVIGAALEAAVMLALVTRGKRLAWRWPSLRDRGLGEVVRGYGPLLLGAAALGLVPVVDRVAAAFAGEGAIATLAYAGRLVDPLLATGATAIGTAMLPYAARSVAQGRPDELRATSIRVSALVLAVAVPATLVLVTASAPLVHLLFERGAFTPDDAVAVARLQAVLALQIPIYLVGMVAVRVVAATGAVRLLLVGNLASLALTLALDFVLVGPFGPLGIAIATVATRMIVVGGMLVACARALRRTRRGGA
jgi:putative peptidoglycan lipid II flippase